MDKRQTLQISDNDLGNLQFICEYLFTPNTDMQRILHMSKKLQTGTEYTKQRLKRYIAVKDKESFYICNYKTRLMIA